MKPNVSVLLRIGGVALACTLAGCADATRVTAIDSRLVPSPRPLNSFSQGSDGYYYWDGQAPSGDDADIISATAGGYAPRPNTGGWVSGTMQFVADQRKIDLVYSVNHNGNVYYSNTTASSGWGWGVTAVFGRDQEEYYYDKSLQIDDDHCGFSVLNGGTAYARNGLPFGISLRLIKFSISLVPGAITWGETSKPLTAMSDPGVQCDEDLSGYTDPVPGDPANQTSGGGTQSIGEDGGTAGSGMTTQPTSGSYDCVSWTDWWHSNNGGDTWLYDERECHEWAYVE